MKQHLAIFLISISCFLSGCEQFEANKRGNDYYKQGKYDLAIAEYEKAIRINPNFGEAHNNLGLAYHKQGKYDLYHLRPTRRLSVSSLTMLRHTTIWDLPTKSKASMT